MLLQGMYAHPHVVINTRRPLLPRVPHQGRWVYCCGCQSEHGLCRKEQPGSSFSCSFAC